MSFLPTFTGYAGRRHALWFARVAVASVYIWFGALKVLGLSAAHPMVDMLAQAVTLPEGVALHVVLGIVEVGIGVLFLIPGLISVAFWLMVGHILLTTLPLVLLPQLTWSGLFVPTLEGQYILKNIALLALGLILLSRRKRR